MSMADQITQQRQAERVESAGVPVHGGESISERLPEWKSTALPMSARARWAKEPSQAQARLRRHFA